MGTHERCWRWFVALAMLGLGAVVAWMIPTPEGPPPWVPIADLAARHGEASTREVAVRGMLVRGSLRRDDEACLTQFELSDPELAAATVRVRYAHCVVPDTLRDSPGRRPEITAIGRLRANGHFEAEQLLAKVGGPYEVKERAQAPSAPLTKLKAFEEDPPPDIAKALRAPQAVPSGSTSHDTFSP